MARINIKLWRDYKLGRLNRELSSEEQMEVDNCELAMNLLLPTKSFINLYKKLQEEGWNENQIFNILCMTFRVPAEVIQVKLNETENNMSYYVEEDISVIRKENIKIRCNLSFWKVYKMDKLNRELYPLEEMRVSECDDAMNKLVPDEIFIPIYEALRTTDITKIRLITMLAIRFKVPTDIIEVKIYEYEKEKNEKKDRPKLVK